MSNPLSFLPAPPAEEAELSLLDAAELAYNKAAACINSLYSRTDPAYTIAFEEILPAKNAIIRARSRQAASADRREGIEAVRALLKGENNG